MRRLFKPDTDQRQDARLKIPPMYTTIQVRPVGNETYCWMGHIYDVSAKGLRFELDAAVEPGTRVDVRATLPDVNSTTVCFSGRIVRCHDDPDEIGPVRMGMVVDSFQEATDRRYWLSYLQNNSLDKAA